MCNFLYQSNKNALNGMWIAFYWPAGISVVR